MSNLDDLANALRRRDRRYQPALATAVLQVATVERDSSGAIVSATGTLDGAGEFTVPLKGHSAGAGDFLLVGYPGDQPVGAELAYLRHVASAYAGAGLVAVNGDLPAPAFAAVPFTSAIVALPGSITAKASIFFVAVEARYQPSGYTVSYRINGGEWRDRAVPHIGGTQECDLGSDLPPGATIDAHLRARYQWNAVESPPTADSTFTAAVDTSSPGTVTALAVGVATPGQLSITPTATLDSALFRGYRYEINDAATGSPDIASVPIPGPWDAVLPPGTYYVAAVPVSKSGTLGTRLPATPNTYQGPYVVADQAANLDTTPPPNWTAPTLVGSNVQGDIGGERPQVAITFPAYSYPSDYDHTIVRLANGSAFDQFTVPYPGAAHDPITRPLSGYGTWQATLQGVDRAGNRSTTSSAGSAVVSPSGVAAAAGDATTSSVSLGVKVAFTKPANATIVKIWRATSVGGAGAAVIGQTDSDYFLDLLAGVGIALSQYWYKIQGTNLAGDGTISPTWVPGTVGAYDGSNVAVNSMEANVLKAATTLTSLLRTATSGTRWEIEGHTGGGLQDQIRAYEAITGVDKLRLKITGAGLFIYNDSAAEEGAFYRDSTGHTHFSLGVNPTYGIPAIDIAWDNGLSKFVSSLDVERTRQLYKANTTNLYVDSATVGSNTHASVQFSANSPSGEPIAVYKHLTDAGLLYLLPAGIGVYVGSTTYTLAIDGNAQWAASVPLMATALHAGPLPSYVASWPSTVKQASSLGFTAANSQPLAAWQYPTANIATLRLSAFRGATVGTSDWQEARFRLLADIDNLGANGGGADFGFKAYAAFFSLHTGGTARLYWDDPNTRILIPNDLRVDGAISKGSGTFDIPHPDPDKDADGYRLRHSLVESPTRGDNLYRFAVIVAEEEVGKEIAVDLPDYWPWLNEDGQCWTSPVRHFGRSWAEVARGGERFVFAADAPGAYNVLVIGTRKDATAVRGWDDTGGIEPLANDADRERQHKRRDSLGRKIAPRKVAV